MQLEQDLEVRPAVQRTLADYTRADLILPRLRESDTTGVIGELSQVLQRTGCVPDILPFYHAALNQELMSSSALGCGIAFPHARLSGVKQLQYAFGKSVHPMLWGAKGSAFVDWVFLLAVPATDAACYLHLLAGIARLGQRPDLLVALRSAEDVSDLRAVFGQILLKSA